SSEARVGVAAERPWARQTPVAGSLGGSPEDPFIPFACRRHNGGMLASLLPASSFRQMFPALARQVWLDTPSSPPGAAPVTSALASAIGGWQEGSLDAADWAAAGPQARFSFARYLGAPESHVALLGSVAEAAATVAASLPGRGGAIVAGDGEFRSNLFPWLALEARGYRVIRVPAEGASRTESLLAAIDE